MTFIKKIKQRLVWEEKWEKKWTEQETLESSDIIYRYEDVPTSTLWKTVWMYRSKLRTDIIKNLTTENSKELLDKMKKIWYNWRGTNKKERKNKLQQLKEIKTTYESILENHREEQLNLLQDYEITSNKDNLTIWSKERFEETTELSFKNSKTLEELPNRISNMQNLKYLNIENIPKLKELPNRIIDIPIEKLNLINTWIKKFQDEILPFLKKLKENNQITIKQTTKNIPKKKPTEKEFKEEFKEEFKDILNTN